MRKAEAVTDCRASTLEVAIWSIVMVIAAVIPGLGLIIGVGAPLTRLGGNRVARIAVPVLGAVATVFWSVGLISGVAGSAAGVPVRR